MRHVSEQRLILFHYGESPEAEAETIRMHLADCGRCTEAYAGLAATLGALDSVEVPQRPADYGERVWRRVARRALEQPRADWRDRFNLPRLALASSMALLLVVAFLTGQRFGNGSEALGKPARERILLVTVGDHLERSERLLIELVNATPEGSRDLTAQKARASQLAADNRIYRQTAGGAGEAEIAELLDELERFLIEVANSPTLLTSNELHDLQSRAARRGLLMKIHVLGRDARERARQPALVAPERHGAANRHDDET